MIDAKRLLDQFLGTQQTPEPGNPSHGGPSAAGNEGGGIAGALGGIHNYARQNPMLAGGLAGGLAAILLGSKGGRKLAKNALTYGGIAAIGGLAYKAYRDYQESKQQPAPAANARMNAPMNAPANTPMLPPPSDSPFSVANAPQGADQFALALVTAMIAAAKADGHVDEQERHRILGKLSENGLDAEEQAFLARELTGPLDIDRVVKAAATKEQAIELYAASFLAITPDHPAERAYLSMLAARLGLEPDLATMVERTVANAMG